MVHFLFSTLREWIRYLVYIIIQKSETLKVLLKVSRSIFWKVQNGSIQINLIL